MSIAKVTTLTRTPPYLSLPLNLAVKCVGLELMTAPLTYKQTNTVYNANTQKSRAHIKDNRPSSLVKLRNNSQMILKYKFHV